MASKKGYFGMGRLVSIILAIIPITSLICGILTRFNDKKPVAGILRIFFGWNIMWLLDLICMIVNGSICRILKC